MLSFAKRLNVLSGHITSRPSALSYSSSLARQFTSSTTTPPRLVVIGGVAGGASVAARARRLSEHAEITVLEKGPDVSFANCGMPYFIGDTIKDESKLLLHTPESLSTLLRLNIKANSLATKIDRSTKLVHYKDMNNGVESSIPYDKLVLSMGAFPTRPPLPGLDNNPRVMTLRNLQDMKAIKQRVASTDVNNVVVLGAGFIGIEMAEQLQEIGKTVSLVERESSILPLMDADMTLPLMEHMAMQGIQVIVGDGVQSVSNATNTSVSVSLGSGRNLSADLVILSVGVRPDTALAGTASLKLTPTGHVQVNEYHQTSDSDIYAVGDCVVTKDGVLEGQTIAAALAGPANRQARLVANHIYAPYLQDAYPGSLGTAILKCFDLAAGITGWSEKRLKRANIPYRTTTVSGFGHASYYPGALPLTVKICWCPTTHRLLGAQVVGSMGSGVDKRLDVLATALQARMTIQQLVHLELSYAPPFGSAKDVLNVAAFTAMNQLHGMLRAIDSLPTDESYQVVDVREPEVVAVKPLSVPSVNIPLSKLRASVNSLDKSKPVVTVCNVGKTSYFAARVLAQSGFENVFSLQGGTSKHHELEPHESPASSATTDHKSQVLSPAPTAAQLPTVHLDCSGLACPGPLLKMKRSIDTLSDGQDLVITATDMGFANDVKAFCRTNNLQLVEVKTQKGVITAHLRRPGVVVASKAASSATPSSNQLTPSMSANQKDASIIVFSRDMDKVLASLVLANGVCAMGGKVTMFFTFWGLAALRKPEAGSLLSSMSAGKSFIDRAMGYMLGAGPSSLPLSNMNFVGAGPLLMKHQMNSKNLPTVESLLKEANENKIRMIACSMSMEAMGIKKEELVDNVEIGGVADFLASSQESGLKLFI